MNFYWKFINQSYGSTAVDVVSELTPSAGGNFKRQLFTKQEDIINGYIIVDKIERENFRAFYLRDTQQGQKSFVFYDATIEENRLALFNGTLKENKQSNQWKISFSLRLGIPKTG